MRLLFPAFVITSILAVGLPASQAAATPEETVLYRFTAYPHDGANPRAGLIADQNGNLYGTTEDGGPWNYGTVFKLTPPATASGAWTETVLYSFTGHTDGEKPLGGLIADQNGNLYGTTYDGGASGYGTVFELGPPAVAGGSWTETVLHSFDPNGSDGFQPTAGLIADQNGNLYGTTQYGGGQGYCGSPGCGTVFELTPPATPGGTWTETVLHSFAGYPNDGGVPTARLIVDKKRNLYGTTYIGGPGCSDVHGCGTVFKLTPPTKGGGTWTETVLYSFLGGNDGAFPYYAGLIADKKGNLYGTTEEGGNGCEIYGCGTVFELTPPAKAGGPWTENVLFSFGSSYRGFLDGGYPLASLIADKKGNLYGTTSEGGSGIGCNGYCTGTVFELSPPAVAGGAWTETVLYSFTGGSDGAGPHAALIADKKGNLYGTTAGGGVESDTCGGCGTVFELTKTGFVR
jgi:uncharacterized repeat protein (TIGR03803 family)